MIRAVLSLFGAIALTACQHHPAPQPAVLIDADAATLDAVRAGLAPTMGRANIEFGAGDPTVSPSIAVLPPKPSALETQSVAMPTLFNLYMKGATCVAIREGTEEEIILQNVACRPL
ncbi:MAG: hypothetical protein AAGJ51_00845 [Pseudomonadota bacterium]